MNDILHIITGATGFLGRNLVERLLDNGERLCIVVRSNEHDFQERAEIVFPGYASKYGNRFSVVNGDITKENLGISSKFLNEIKNTRINFWHLAANLSFKYVHKEQIYRDNVRGVENVVNLINTLGSDVHLYYTSTAYICGSKNKQCSENEIDRGQNSRNLYEKTKIAAERIISEKCNKHHIIFRPSIIIGDAYEGKAVGCTFGYYRFSFVFFAFKGWVIKNLNKKRGFWKTILLLLGARYDKKDDILGFSFLLLPYPNGSTVNLIPLDFVVDSMVDISNKCQENKTFHVVDPNPPSFIFLFENLLDNLSLTGIKFFPVPPAVFNFIIKVCYMIIIPLRKYFESAIKYQPYITVNYDFITDNMKEYGLIPAEISKIYIGRVNRYAIENIFKGIK